MARGVGEGDQPDETVGDGAFQTPLPPERRAEVPWLFIRQQTGIGVLVCCTIPSSSRPLSENDEAEINSAQALQEFARCSRSWPGTVIVSPATSTIP